MSWANQNTPIHVENASNEAIVGELARLLKTTRYFIQIVIYIVVS
jgi:hypothetical protein